VAGDWQPRVRIVQGEAAELRRRHADDGDRRVVERDDAAGDQRVASEAPLPAAVTEDGHGFGIGRRVPQGIDHAAEQRAHAKRGEEVAGHEVCGKRPLVAAKRQRAGVLCQHRRERARVLAKEDDLGVRQRGREPIRRAALEAKQRVWIPDRQGPRPACQPPGDRRRAPTGRRLQRNGHLDILGPHVHPGSGNG
jgi:hypothetical protein